MTLLWYDKGVKTMEKPANWVCWLSFSFKLFSDEQLGITEGNLDEQKCQDEILLPAVNPYLHSLGPNSNLTSWRSIRDYIRH